LIGLVNASVVLDGMEYCPHHFIYLLV